MVRLFFVTNRQALRDSIQEILGWDFERITPGHGEVLERSGKDAMREAWLK